MQFIQEYRWWILAALGVLYIVFKFMPAIQQRVVAARQNTGVGFGPAVEADEDTADFQAIKRIQARGERLGCEELKEAAGTCLQHFFHHGEE
jgi:hypothetical protein